MTTSYEYRTIVHLKVAKANEFFNHMENLVLAGVPVSAIVYVVVNVLKPHFPEKFHALSAVITGGVIGMLMALSADIDVLTGIIFGIMSGASTAGIYKATKDITTQ